MSNNRLIEIFSAPECALRWTDEDWSLAVRQARAANLLASLGDFIDTMLPQIHIPEPAVQHFTAARNLVSQRNEAVRWECEQIVRTLLGKSVRVAFLKGAAYVLSNIPMANGRHFSDIDILVDRGDLAEAEKQLMLAGWLPTNADPYDQHYYRTWMHEVPPLRHIRRGTVLDLHHTICPPTSKYQADTSLLRASLTPVKTVTGALVLGPTDMVLHAAAHLFSEGESENALRNLIDISELLDFFQSAPEFHTALAKRAFQVGLSRPLYYAIRYLMLVLRQARRSQLAAHLETAKPKRYQLQAMDAIYIRSFQGGHPSTAMPMGALASAALYFRGHWLRMPAKLLLPHLARKLLRSISAKSSL